MAFCRFPYQGDGINIVMYVYFLDELYIIGTFYPHHRLSIYDLLIL